MKEIFICVPSVSRFIMQEAIKSYIHNFYEAPINIISGRKSWKNGWQFRESDAIARRIDTSLLLALVNDELRSDISSRPIDTRESTRTE